MNPSFVVADSGAFLEKSFAAGGKTLPLSDKVSVLLLSL
jgi:hypothetical protein